MLPVIVFPDTELWATSWLRAALADRAEAYAAGVWVSNKVPTTRTDRMVIVRRDGGPRADLVHEVSRLAVQVWGSTDQEATDLAGLVRALLGSVSATDPVEHVAEISGPAYVADASGQPLIYLTFELTIRGAAA